MAQRLVKWSGMGDAVVTGVLVATALDAQGEPTETRTRCDLRTIDGLGEWSELPESARWLIARGTKEAADNSTAGSARDPKARIAQIESAFADILSGNLPGMRSRMSDVIRAAAEYFGVSDGEMLERWDSYDEKKQEAVKAHSKVREIAARIVAERAQERAAKLAESDTDAGDLDF